MATSANESPTPREDGVLSIAVLTISDTRTAAQDTSGDALVSLLGESGHVLADRDIVRDDVYVLRAKVSNWIADPAIDVVLTSGGTGFTGRDSTPEALAPLFDKTIDGFGELFRAVSYEEIGSSTIQSRAIGGLANATLIFALPGSTGAVRTAWDKILRNQLDVSFRPCNFVELIHRFNEHLLG
ncbi:MAG: molybdenum cofactor biosynthesis protein B [Pseudomonadaceae bacterium]|nr:molybdenum cofactor biosynthesis protein B [Pseudomonadaceae bacterium]